MQSFDEGKNLLKTQTGDLEKLLNDVPKIKGATHHVIGNLPQVGQKTEINGLIFRVRKVKKNGDVSLRIFTP